jgi:hypothetical protein
VTAPGLPEDGLAGVIAEALVDFWCADLDPEEAEYVREMPETAEAADAYAPALAAKVRAHLAATDREREAAALEAAWDEGFTHARSLYDGAEIGAASDNPYRDRAAALRADDGSGS